MLRQLEKIDIEEYVTSATSKPHACALLHQHVVDAICDPCNIVATAVRLPYDALPALQLAELNRPINRVAESRAAKVGSSVQHR
eukprot:5012459-Pleurochrysis_carterae.AAC.1